MDIILGDDGIRRRKTAGLGTRSRTQKLCTGKDNTCSNVASSNNICKGCASGNYRVDKADHDEGENFEKNGIRYIYTGGQKRKICGGNENTCDKLARDGGLCIGCATGNPKTVERQAGDIVTIDNIRSKYDGKQLRRLCTGDNNACAKVATVNGMCKLHANGGQRKKIVKKINK